MARDTSSIIALIGKVRKMPRIRSRKIRTLVVPLVAIGVGVLLAFAATGGGQPAFAAASTHCTRYVPGTPQDFACGVVAYNPVGMIVSFMTSSYAYRDDNYIYVSSTDNWDIYYVLPGSGLVYDQKVGTGNGGLEGSSGQTAYAGCMWANDPVSNYNDCTTDWH